MRVDRGDRCSDLLSVAAQVRYEPSARDRRFCDKDAERKPEDAEQHHEYACSIEFAEGVDAHGVRISSIVQDLKLLADGVGSDRRHCDQLISGLVLQLNSGAVTGVSFAVSVLLSPR